MTEWYLPVARAAPALALAAVVTFTADHSAGLGLLLFGFFALAAGAVITIFAVRSPRRAVTRSIQIAQGFITTAAGVVALSIPGAGLPFLVFLVTAFAALTGFLELYVGLRERGKDASARDWAFVGGLTALLAVIVLLVPPGFSQPVVADEVVVGQLTASVIVVGVLGAYWAILGVYLVIAGLSLKWSGAPASVASEA